MTSHALPLIRRLLHWAVAILVVLMVPAGLIIVDFDNRGPIDAVLGKGAFGALYDLHKSTGVVVLALMAARIGARLVWPDPPHSPPLPRFNHVASRLAHGALYALLVITPLLGWAGVSAFPAPVPVYWLFEMPALVGADRALSDRLLWWHGVCALTLAGIAVVHILAALHHRLVRRDRVFERIALRLGR